ncbi:DUF3817 domain-containing protein [Actinokineospora bangkokensis]|uniref:Export protein n=1 Tax=Actinokineospora bangkokensis TaxID=1193682 RepID=A0A1Q9LHI4_9PSEU|nr:DUF3817 domain-containing protein [Actinokineospora bangkokensis]OLR91483.1 export protein [Actinokineospora bangkokensis]
MFATAAGRFRAVALLEAVSWLGLLVGMFFKYATDAGDAGVKLFGPIHGVVFVAYVITAALAAREYKWSRWTTFWGLLCSIPPLFTLVFERYALRTGRLDPIGPVQSSRSAEIGVPEPAGV